MQVRSSHKLEHSKPSRSHQGLSDESSWVDDECLNPDPCGDDAKVDDGDENYGDRCADDIYRDDSCWTESLSDERLTLPKEKPDIERILRINVRAKVVEWDVIRTTHGNKAVVFGELDVQVEYVSQAGEQSVHFAAFKVPFHTFFTCSHPIQTVTAQVEHTHFLNYDLRSLSVATLLLVQGEE